jgi:hypothetical protein
MRKSEDSAVPLGRGLVKLVHEQRNFFPLILLKTPQFPVRSLFQSKNEPEGSCWRGQLRTSPFRDFFIYVSWLS